MGGSFNQMMVDLQSVARRWWDQFRHWPSHTKAGVLVTFGLGLLVFLAATWPGSSSRAGEWKPLLDDAAVGVAIRTAYQPENGKIQLQLDTHALGQVVRDQERQRWVAAHVRRFNRQFRNRRFDPKFIPRDSIFKVEMVTVDGKTQPKLQIRDLSPFNTHPIRRQSDRVLGAIYLRPGDQPAPFLSDGFLGLSLEPGGGPTQTIPLNQPGLHHGHRFHLVDDRGLGVATIWAAEDGMQVFVQGEAGRGVFIDNNAPLDDATRGLGPSELIELAGRFFEVRIEAAPVLAMNTDRGPTQKRIYPMGSNLHFVGPISRNGRHQSLGLEYMFQEYLFGLPEAGIPAGELWLTLDSRLQGAWVAGMARLAQRSERHSASGLLMNAKTGEIIAMAAQPQPYDPGDSDLVLRMLDRGEERFANHGCFRRHVIGSVTKPFFAFLALNLIPEWDQVQVEVRGEASQTLFGHQLYGKRGKAMAFKRNQIGFDTYLINSDNAFQHSLGLLMLAGVTDLGALPKPWLVEQAEGGLLLRPTANEKTPLSIGSLGAMGKNSLSVERDNAFAKAARDLFDLETTPIGARVNDRDLRLFKGFLPTAETLLLRHHPRLLKPRDVLRRRSVVCAPAYPRLALEAVANTKDASNLLFGGKFNLWTDVKLCEAFSRMITGRRVEAQIIYQFRDTLGDGEIVSLIQEAEPFRIPEDVRDAAVFRTIRQHLGEVVRSGTAKKLVPTISDIRSQPGQNQFRMFAKTGTIDDGKGRDSRLVLATFGLWDAAQEDFQGNAYTFVLYLRNALAEEDILDFIGSELPKWWALLQKPTMP